MAFERLTESRFAALLLALTALLVTTPLVEQVDGAPWLLLDALFTAMMLALLYAMNREPHFMTIAIVLALPAVGTRWGARVTDDHAFLIASFVVQIAFLGISMWVVLREILRSERVTTDTVFGGISVYLLIGMTFALVFGLIAYLDADAFAFQTANDGVEARLPGHRGFAELVYFSFISLTTLGYGDIVPVAREARSMALLEAVIGQIYLLVFIARLVGLHVVHARPGDPEI